MQSASIARFGSRPGPNADLDRNRRIANIVGQHDGRWWNRSPLWKREPSLSLICAELDQANIAVPSNWREGRTRSLSRLGLDLRGWTDALDLGFRTLVIDQIAYNLGRILRTR
jgi:hypothetical protein